ncbi:GntR family transcriptional regulator [Elongatibacter sediminis]|uniref:GntR family transcriptional regulator n=1 Tax=Elongatibacter sediminis TaxID=3119006 RepID=A0AAW9RDW7_9GAMM
MKLNKVVKREPLRQQVLASLKNALINGDLTPGQRLTEEGVAEFLGVSRTPAREALAILHQAGSIKRRENGGFEVIAPTMEDIEQIFQVRHRLEPYAARLAAEKVTSGDIRQLQKYLAEQEAHVNAVSATRYLEADRALRGLLFSLSGNQQLVDCIGRYEEHLQFVAALTLKDPAIRRIAMNVDRPLVEAISKRDPEAAEAAAHTQLEEARKALMQVLGDAIESGLYG